MHKKILAVAVIVPFLAFGVASATQNEEPKIHKVTICHHTHSETTPTVTIEVDKHAVKAHLKHGDTMGACPPKEEPPTPPVTETPKEQPKTETKVETPAPVTNTPVAPSTPEAVAPEVFEGK